MNYKADIGVFGGSGFYSFLEDIEEIDIETPYGSTSEKVSLGKVGGKTVAFLPRHGKKHSYPPHMIPYRAKCICDEMLGVRHIIAPTASEACKLK